MRTPQRRRILKLAATAAVLPAGTTWLTGCNSASDEATSSGNTVNNPGTVSTPTEQTASGGEQGTFSFLHGVASGDPLADAVILWTRVTPDAKTLAANVSSVDVSWAVSPNNDFSGLVQTGRVRASRETDWTVKIDAMGLSPGFTYFYRFTVGTVVSPTGRTKTTRASGLDAVRLAICTCSDWARGLYNAYDRMADLQDLDAVIHLGDYIYESGSTNRVRPQNPPVELRTVDQYRARYATHRTDPALARLHQNHPFIWVWDDHETCDGAWKNGADPSNHDEAEDGPYAVRKANALKAALEWMPIRSPDPAQPERIYRRFKFGDLIDLFMLDTRRIGRDQQGEPNAVFGNSLPAFTQTGTFAQQGRHILGQEQETWLTRGLASATARWNMLGNQVVFSPLKVAGLPRSLGGGLFANPDQWDGYEPARDRVAQALAKSRGRNIILTGDVHASMIFDAVLDPNNPAEYSELNRNNSLGVEFVTPSISSAGDPQTGGDPEAQLETLLTGNADALRASNPHLKMFEATLNGYLLLRVSENTVRGEFWTVPTVLRLTREQSMLAAYEVKHGEPFCRNVA